MKNKFCNSKLVWSFCFSDFDKFCISCIF